MWAENNINAGGIKNIPTLKIWKTINRTCEFSSFASKNNSKDHSAKQPQRNAKEIDIFDLCNSATADKAIQIKNVIK